jgi:alpha-L-fucosidase
MKRFDDKGMPTPEAVEDERRLQERYSGYRGVDADYVHAGSEALERWWDMKFGIRIHWSLYAIMGLGGESWPLCRPNEYLPARHAATFRAQYEEQYKSWMPSQYDARQWCDMFQRAGLKFFTLTAKHHDGFSLYDTKARVRRRRVHVGPDAGKIVPCDLAYSIMEGPYRRDIVRELTTEARSRGLGIGLYYSNIDWFDMDFRIDDYMGRDWSYNPQSAPEGFARLIARHRAQVLELCSNYGPIDMLSMDTYFADFGRKWDMHKRIHETVKLARRLQPNLLFRNRNTEPFGDYCTPEGTVPPDPNDPETTVGLPWKVIYPGGDTFSFKWGDNYKPASWIISNLVDIVAKGGNFQVGYGPGPNGEWDPIIVRRLEQVGDWLKANGEGIFATRPCQVWREGENVRYTRAKDGKTVYAFLLNWQNTTAQVRLTGVRAKSGSQVRMLGVDHSFKYAQDPHALTIEVPADLLANTRLPDANVALAFKIEVER